MERRLYRHLHFCFLLSCVLQLPVMMAAPTQALPSSSSVESNSSNAELKNEDILENAISHLHDHMTDRAKENVIPHFANEDPTQQLGSDQGEQPDSHEPSSVTQEELPPTDVVNDTSESYTDNSMMGMGNNTEDANNGESNPTSTLSNVISRGPVDRGNITTPTPPSIPTTEESAAVHQQSGNDSKGVRDLTSPPDTGHPERQDSHIITTDSSFGVSTSESPPATTDVREGDHTMSKADTAVEDDMQDDGVKSFVELLVNKEGDNPSTRSGTWNDTDLHVSLSNAGDAVLVTWEFDSNDTDVTGFKVSYRTDGNEDYDSSTLGRRVRSFSLHSLHEDEDYSICVHVLVNYTAVKEACAEWSESSMKMVVGIMAGLIFLIPCGIVVTWIIHKDRKVRQRYLPVDKGDEPVNKATDNNEKQKPHPLDQNDHNGVLEGKGKSIGGKSRAKSSNLKSNPKSLEKTLCDHGHENPCTPVAEDDDDFGKNGPWKRMSQQGAQLRAKVVSTPQASAPASKESSSSSQPKPSNHQNTDSSASATKSNQPAQPTVASTSQSPTVPTDSIALSTVHSLDDSATKNTSCTAHTQNGNVPHACNDHAVSPAAAEPSEHEHSTETVLSGSLAEPQLRETDII